MEKKSKALSYRSIIPTLKLEDLKRTPTGKLSSPRADSDRFQINSNPSRQNFSRKGLFNLAFEEDTYKELSETSSELERAQMTSEDFRSYELRKTERKLQINPQASSPDFIEVTCSLSDLYEFHSNIGKIIAFTEDEGSDKFSISLADLALNLSIVKSGYELTTKEEITQNLFDFSYYHTDEKQEEDFKRAYNELWDSEVKLPLHLSSKTDTQAQSEMQNRQIHALAIAKNIITEKLEWQSTELSVLKQKYNDKLKEVNKTMSTLEYQHKVVKQQTITYVKGKERIDYEKRVLKNERECLKQMKIQHKGKVERFKEKTKEFLEDLKQYFSINVSCSLNAKDSVDSELSSIQNQISELEKSFSVSPSAENTDKEMALSHLKTKYAELRSSNALGNYTAGKGMQNSFVLSDHNDSHNISLLSEDPHSDTFDDTPLLKEITIIKARLQEKQEELERKEKELSIQWAAAFVVDDILPEIQRHSDGLRRIEDNLDKVQEDIDKQKVQMAFRQSQMHKKESEIAHKQDMFYRSVGSLYHELDNIIHQTI